MEMGVAGEHILINKTVNLPPIPTPRSSFQVVLRFAGLNNPRLVELVTADARPA